MRYALPLAFTVLIGCSALIGCGPAEPPATQESSDEHFLSEQERALKKAKEAAAAIEKASNRTKDLVDKTVDEIEKSKH